MISTIVLFLMCQTQTAQKIQVIDLDGGEPRHVVVVVDGEPFKITTIPAGSGPGPGPAPPVPDPVPVVVPGTLWITYIMSPQATVAETSVIDSAELRKLVDGKTVAFRFQTAGDQELIRRKLDSKVQELGTPVAIFQDQAGKIVKTVKGSNPDAIIQTVCDLKGLAPK
jgi:hypothetical protein